VKNIWWVEKEKQRGKRHWRRWAWTLPEEQRIGTVMPAPVTADLIDQ
jgi:hypothetical protein